jgi:hypothetical protein
MLTVSFLQSSGLEALCSRFAISAKRHGRYPNLVQLKYNQIESPMEEPIVRECRGLIVDEADGWRVVCRPYDKFFNYGEPLADALDWSTAKVYEKLDGSLMTLYWYRGEWQVASSGLPDAAGKAHAGDATFAELFHETWKKLGYALPDAPERCHIFELMTPMNRIIVQHRESRIVLHGVRDLRDMRELDPEPIAARLGWACVGEFPLTTIEQCLEASKLLHPMQGEGYVVRDAAFRRLKVKSPQYVAMAHIKDHLTGRRLLEIVRANESSEFLAYFPEFRPAYEKVKQTFESLCAEVEGDFARLKEIPDAKAFAAEALKTRSSGAVFALRSRKSSSAKEFFATTTFPAVERALGLDLVGMIVNAPGDDV